MAAFSPERTPDAGGADFTGGAGPLSGSEQDCAKHRRGAGATDDVGLLSISKALYQPTGVAVANPDQSNATPNRPVSGAIRRFRGFGFGGPAAPHLPATHDERAFDR